jgi:D-alanyl-D-alanine dipeptidase
MTLLAPIPDDILIEEYPAIQPLAHLRPEYYDKGDLEEPLEQIAEKLSTRNIYNELGLPQRDNLLLRGAVIKRLVAVNDSLPKDYQLLILDAHRTMDFQQALLSSYLKIDPSLTKGWVADPKFKAVAPPHTTGGAIDLTLAYKGVGLALGTEYDAFEDAAELDYYELTRATAAPAAKLRRMLYLHMIAQGFAPYQKEWWHWSYGDQKWAAYYGKRSIYGTIG